MTGERKLFLLDAYALIYRAYYGFINNPRMNSKGQNTSAVFGFLNTLEDLLKRQNPSHIAVAFDPPGPTFRHLAFEQYKAQREKTPEVITWSIPWIKAIIEAYNIPIIEIAGFEADDVIGTMSVLADKVGFEVFMMTPDKDFGQLVTEHVHIYKPKYGSNEFEIVGPTQVLEKYGLSNTLQMIDYLGLVGDASDNIPGCPGVGDVSARKLIAEFGSIEQLLANTEKLKGSLKDKIVNNKEIIEFSKFLATIKTDVPIIFDEEGLRRKDVNEQKLSDLYSELEFRTHQNRLNQKSSVTAKLVEKKEVVPSDTKSVVTSTKETHGQFSLWDVPSNDAILSSPLSTTGDALNEQGEQGNENEIDASEGTGIAKYSNLRTLKTTAHTYYLIENESDFCQFFTELFVQKTVAFDTETTGLDANTAELVGMSFCWEQNKAFYMPYLEDTEKKSWLEKIKQVLENPTVLKIGQNIKYDMVVLSKYGFKIQGPLFDTMIAHYLIQPELRHGMDYMAEIYLNYKTIHIEEILGSKGKNQKNMRDLSPKDIYEYAAEDADVTFQLKEILEKEIAVNGLDFLCYKVEMPLVKVLVDMEIEGVNIDRNALKMSSNVLTVTLKKLEEDIQELAGIAFNVNSPKQIGEVLFERLKIDVKAKKTKTGQFTTSEDVLEKLKSKHPIVEKILEQRGLKKLLGTYIDALPELVNPRTGKIHTSYNQAVTSTGRLSSSNPNLQNIPVRDALGREIRQAFSAGKDDFFFSADYSQIELRLMAHLSQDANMLDAFCKDLDIHAATAAKIYKVPLVEVQSDMRRKAKTANFGIIYGISVFGLAERMNVGRGEAKELIDGYFESYPNVKSYMDQCISDAKQNGWVETMFHRKRYLQDIHSQNANVRGYAERNAINAPIQGSAADIIKIAMVNIHKSLLEKNLKSKMIMQVHDELNFIVPENEVEIMKELIVNEMQNAVKLDVPLKAELGIGRNWLEAHS
jgi:DNA polymerase I